MSVVEQDAQGKIHRAASPMLDCFSCQGHDEIAQTIAELGLDCELLDV